MLKTGGGHRPWEEWEIERFRDFWPSETVERVAFELLLNTGQRGGDVKDMDRRHYKDGWISVSQEKTKARLEIPATEELREILATWLSQHTHILILTTPTGRPFKIDHFRHTMKAAYRAAKLAEDCTTHGLRYTAATILKELGSDWETIASITGHATAEMARKYTRQRRRAEIAITKLDEVRKQRKRTPNEPHV